MHDRGHDPRVVEDRGEHGDEDDRRQDDDGEDEADLRDADRITSGTDDRHGIPNEVAEKHLFAFDGEVEQPLNGVLNGFEQVRREKHDRAEGKVEHRAPDDDPPGEAFGAARLADEISQEREGEQAEERLPALRGCRVRRRQGRRGRCRVGDRGAGK